MATTTIPARDANAHSTQGLQASTETRPRKFIRRPGESATTGADSASPREASPKAQSTSRSPSAPERSRRAPTDDEILGLTGDSGANRYGTRASHSSDEDPFASDESSASSTSSASPDSDAEAGRASEAPPEADAAAPAALPAALRAVLDENPELRRAWQEREDYRQSFASPEDARAATAQLRDLDRMDALFFSRRPEDHAQLAAVIATLDPAAFASLAQAMTALANSSRENAAQVSRAEKFPGRADSLAEARTIRSSGQDGSDAKNAKDPSYMSPGPTAAQTEFFHATNTAAVEGVLGAIESQVEKLLPEGVSKTARARVVGEIYRELDSTLRSNYQLARQLREAFRSGALDADHQRGIVSMVLGRARQALPAVAKRVLNEWTSTIVAANQERRSRQRAAERRVDIAGSSGAGNDGRRPITPRDINYSRMSDADILNM